MTRRDHVRRITACLLLACGYVTAATAAQPMTLSDVMALEYAADPRFSPDGERIVYVRMSADPMTDRYRASLSRSACSAWRLSVASRSSCRNVANMLAKRPNTRLK